MKKAFFSLAAVALILCAGALMLSPDLIHAAYGLSDQGPAFAAGLVALRADLVRLTGDAERKLTEITDGMESDAVRAIETAHADILRQIEVTKAEITRLEEEERSAANNRVAVTGAQAADILSIGNRSGMPVDQIEAAIRDGLSVEDFRVRAFDHLAGQSNRTRTEPGRVIRDERETRRLGMSTAIAFRMGGMDEPTGDRAGMARAFMESHDVVEFAAAAIGHRGAIRTVRDRENVLERAFHATSDFPAIFSDAINTTLERRYALAQPTYREISRRRDFMDFRPHYAVGIGEFPMLQRLTDSGEIRFGSFGENKEQIAVVPYARGIRISRQMLVNDRLGAIGDVMGGYGRTVSRFEEITFYAMMMSANTKLSDGKPVFHSDHGNLASAGTVIDTASLSKGKKALRKQKGLDDAILGLTASILLVSPDKEEEALKYLAPIAANDSLKVNIHVGTLKPIVADQLDGNAWHLFANPEDSPVYQWGYLDGYTAPRIRFDEPFGTQGVAMTVEHDFGVGAVDFRGAYKNPGEAPAAG